MIAGSFRLVRTLLHEQYLSIVDAIGWHLLLWLKNGWVNNCYDTLQSATPLSIKISGPILGVGAIILNATLKQVTDSLSVTVSESPNCSACNKRKYLTALIGAIPLYEKNYYYLFSFCNVYDTGNIYHCLVSSFNDGHTFDYAHVTVAVRLPPFMVKASSFDWSCFWVSLYLKYSIKNITN